MFNIFLYIQKSKLVATKYVQASQAGHNATAVTPSHGKKKFELDIWYVDHISFATDCKVIWTTILKVIKRADISEEGYATMEYFNGKN